MTQAVVLSLILFFAGCATGPITNEKPEKPIAEFMPSSLCKNCHARIYEQHAESMHSKSASNPVYLAQYHKELVPRLSRNPDLVKEAGQCVACHDPEEYVKQGGLMVTSGLSTPRTAAAVTCDFCHSIKGYSGSHPGNGNYISEPGDQKSGPFSHQAWHGKNSRLIKKSEFCGICHNAVNHLGFAVKSTYSEWLESPYRQAKIECQDCHMNREGFLAQGKIEYESGQFVTANMFRPLRDRKKIYSHRFPGGHVAATLGNSVELSIKTAGTSFAPGQKTAVTVSVDNMRVGHKMPTGSLDLRVLWLDVKVYAGGTELPIQIASDGEANVYGLSGNAADDRELIDDIPHGKRVYRAILLDKAGQRTFASYEAAKIGFDNRLNAAEVRHERFRFTIPGSATGPVVIKASLKYLPYTSLFARALGIAKPESQVIATAQAELVLLADRMP